MTKSGFGIKLILVLFTILGCSTGPSEASPQNHRYNVGDHVPLFVNKVGPLDNPSETYQFYQLPFCRPDPVIQKRATLGEVLNGDHLTNALHEMRFREDGSWKILCEKKLKASEVAKFRDAVRNDYYFQMYYDDLPLWGFIGKIEEQNWTLTDNAPKYYLFTHIHFEALYNGNRIIEINAISEPNHLVDITEDVEIKVEFTYSIHWDATSVQYENRMNKYSRASSLPINQNIHWFSLLNSIVTIMFLMALLTLIFMRYLKNDLRK